MDADARTVGQRTSTKVRELELPTGVRLQYVEQGGKEGVPVLLLHGLSDTWRSYEPVLPHLPASVRAIALTQRGHGDSDRPSTYRVQDFAADAAGVLDALAVDAAVVVGHSLGGTIAQRFAIDHSERTRGLVLVSSFFNLATHPAPRELLGELAEMDGSVDPQFVHGFQESTLGSPVSDDLLGTVVAESLKMPLDVWRAVIRDTAEEDFSARLPRIEVPTLLTWGDRDGFVQREEQDGLVDAIALAELEVFDGTGHALHWEQPERFASALTRFVERVR